MWRRVSCEQPLDTSQSILRLSGSIVEWRGDLLILLEPRPWPKGKQVLISVPGSVTVWEPRISSWQHEQSLRRPPEPWEELSFLHKPPSPWNLIERRMGSGMAKSTAVLAVSTGVGRDLENQAEGYGESHQLVPISAAGLLGKQPLVDRIM